MISSTTKPIRSVRVFDTAGRLLHTANPQAADFSFDLPATGIYIVDAQTEADRKTQKVMVR